MAEFVCVPANNGLFCPGQSRFRAGRRARRQLSHRLAHAVHEGKSCSAAKPSLSSASVEVSRWRRFLPDRESRRGACSGHVPKCREAERRATGLGADATVNAPPDRIPKDVMDLTQGRGVNVVIENIGGSVWNAALKCLGRRGRDPSRAAQRLAINRRPICDASIRQLQIFGSTLGIRMNSPIYSNGAQTDAFCLQSTRATRSTGFARLSHISESGAQLGKIAIDV